MTKEKGGLPLRIALATQWRSPSSAATPEGVFSCDNGASKGEASWRSNKICRHEMDDFSTLLKGIYTGNTTNIRNSSLCLDDDILLHSANMITFHDPNLLHIILAYDWHQMRIYSQLQEVGTNLDTVLFEPFATFGPFCPTPPWCSCPAVRCQLTSVLRRWLLINLPSKSWKHGYYNVRAKGSSCRLKDRCLKWCHM